MMEDGIDYMNHKHKQQANFITEVEKVRMDNEIKVTTSDLLVFTMENLREHKRNIERKVAKEILDSLNESFEYMDNVKSQDLNLCIEELRKKYLGGDEK